ncbi:MAG: NAD(P)/FAD-dependent oxidoreductase [Armatimonadota bacterium]
MPTDKPKLKAESRKLTAIDTYDIIIVGTGPAGLGAALRLNDRRPELRILLIDKASRSTGGLRNDCKMNFTYPVGFPVDCWTPEQAEEYLAQVEETLQPRIMSGVDIGNYRRRAEQLDVRLLDIRQCHLGTDGGLKLIKRLMADVARRGIDVAMGETVTGVDVENRRVITDRREIAYGDCILAPGRGGFRFLQEVMKAAGIHYVDHIVDIGIRVETLESRYPIVRQIYDPKFLFPGGVRTFCTNSGAAYVVKERYESAHNERYFSVNGHAYSKERAASGLVNFALLKTVRLTEPLASGQQFAEQLAGLAMLLGGGKPLMQRVGDFRLGKRSKPDTFNGDLFDFQSTLVGATAGDISLAVPGRIMRNLWSSLKLLDTIVPGVLHPSTIMYYPEIKLYANKPRFHDPAYFRALDGLYLIGDGAGASRGITAAWASGLRAADGILAT